MADKRLAHRAIAAACALILFLILALVNSQGPGLHTLRDHLLL